MKKILVMLLCCIITVGAYASKPVSLGVRTGWAYSNLKFKEGGFTKSANGFNLGAFLRANVKKIYIEPAINYAFMKGASEDAAKVNYIQVPVMVGYNLVSIKDVKLRGFVGPEFVFLAKETKKVLNGDLNTVSWYGKVGVGIDVWKITCDLDYKFALSKTGDGVEKGKGVNLTIGFKIF